MRRSRSASLSFGPVGDGFSFPDPHLVDPAALGLEHLDREVVHVKLLAHGRHTTESRQEVPANRLEPLARDLDTEAVGQFVDIDLAAEGEDAFAFILSLIHISEPTRLGM